MPFQKGNQLYKSNPKFTENIGRITKEERNTPEFIAKHKDGCVKYGKLKTIKNDLYRQMTGHEDLNIKAGVNRVLTDAIKDGHTKQFVDLLKLIAPKELDITSGGEKVQMGSVTVNGKELELTIGDSVAKEEEE